LLIKESRTSKEIEELSAYLGNQNLVNRPIQPSGRTLLHTSIQQDDVKSSRCLILNGANVNTKDAKGNLPIHLTSHYRSTKLLLQYGSWKNCLGEAFLTPLHKAIVRQKYKTVRLLLKHKARVDIVDGFFFRTQLDLALESRDPELDAIFSSYKKLTPLTEEDNEGKDVDPIDQLS